MKNIRLRVFIIFLVLITFTINAYSQLTEEQIKAFNSVKKVRILKEHLFLKGYYGSLSFEIESERHFEETAKRLLKSVGVNVVSVDAEKYDATLTIQTKSILFLDAYSDDYSCLLTGSISLEVPGIPIYKKHFRSWANSYTVLSKEYDYLSDFFPVYDVAAIFRPGSFLSKSIEMIGEVFSIDLLNSSLKSTDKDVFSIYYFNSTLKSTVKVSEVKVSEINKINTAFAAGEIKDSSTVESLIYALNDEKKNVRSMAAWALGEINDKRSVEPLVLALKDDYKGVRKNAVQALVKINYEHPIANLYTDILNNKDKYVQFLAKAVLRQMEDNQGINEIIEELNNKKSSVRKMAAESLVEINDTSAVKPLIAALKDEKADVRVYAVQALGNIKDTRAVDPLIVALKDKNSMVRQYVPLALGELKDYRAVEHLIYTLKDKEWWIQKNAAWALSELKDPRSIKPIILSMKKNSTKFGTSGQFRWNAIEALANIGKPAVKPLIDALKDDDVKIDAVIALGLIKDTSAVEPLIAILSDDVYSRSQVVTSLALINDRRAVEPIINCLTDKNEFIQAVSASALGQLGDIRAVKQLISCLDDDWPAVRKNAVWALGKLKDPSAIDPLITTLNDEDENVRKEVVYVLIELTGEDFGEDQASWREWWDQNKENFFKDK